MTALSVNVNKIALLRNARGNDFPNLLGFAVRLMDLGVTGITVHPRPDGRHVTPRDVRELGSFLRDRPGVEFNVEGYPSPRFLDLVCEVAPSQCTLVPDAPGQRTSDHGWDVAANAELLAATLRRLRAAGIRSSLFMEADGAAITQVPAVGADRIELYTERYARDYAGPRRHGSWVAYRDAAAVARQAGLGVNAGHDLNADNLGYFLRIPHILEVSIGHALVVEAIHHGLAAVIARYLAIVSQARATAGE